MEPPVCVPNAAGIISQATAAADAQKGAVLPLVNGLNWPILAVFFPKFPRFFPKMGKHPNLLRYSPGIISKVLAFSPKTLGSSPKIPGFSS